jgi:hypothetical protein
MQLTDATEKYKPLLPETVIRSIVNLIPEEWLAEEQAFNSIEEHRNAYVSFLTTRLANSDFFVNEAIHARESRI